MILTTLNDELNSAFLESMDEAITRLLSQEVVDALYSDLKNKRSINREQIPDNLPTLCIVLEKYFGIGARTIGRAIARRLYSKLGLEFVSMGDYQLINYVEGAKRKFISRSNRNIQVP